jgi:hypothetical protein
VLPAPAWIAARYGTPVGGRAFRADRIGRGPATGTSGDAPVRGLAGPVRSLVGALGRTEVYELGQVVVTLSAVILTVTHCGFGPANPGYGPPVYLCDRSSISVPFGSSSRDAVPCTWALS